MSLASVFGSKSIEDALRKSMTQFRLLLNSTAEGIYGIDNQGNCTFCNNMALKLLGYSEAEEVIGRNMHQLIHHSYYDGNLMPVTECKIYKAFREGVRIHVTDEVFFKKDGQSFPVEYWSYPLFNDEDTTGSVVTFFDLTEKLKIEQEIKESEGRWKFALECAGDGIWDWNLLTDEVYYSFLWKSMLGYEDEISNSLYEWFRRIHPDDFQKCMNSIQLHLEEKEPIFSSTYRMMCKDGSFKWIMARGKIIKYDKYGKPVRMIGTNTDLTEKMQKEEQLRELNATKDKLFSVIAHDLRGPIGSIVNFTEMISRNKNKYTRGEIMGFLGMINSTAEKSLELLDNLLIWARMQKGQIEFKPEYLALQDLCNELMILLKPSAILKEVSIIMNCPQSIICYADRNMLKTILRNLLQNAIKFSFKGGLIEIKPRKIKGYVEMKVTDTGIGMDLQTQNSIFKIGNISRPGTEGEKGSGLGLILCQELVEKHKGRIWVNSSPAKGSTFSFALPFPPLES